MKSFRDLLLNEAYFDVNKIKEDGVSKTKQPGEASISKLRGVGKVAGGSWIKTNNFLKIPTPNKVLETINDDLKKLGVVVAGAGEYEVKLTPTLNYSRGYGYSSIRLENKQVQNSFGHSDVKEDGSAEKVIETELIPKLKKIVPDLFFEYEDSVENIYYHAKKGKEGQRGDKMILEFFPKGWVSEKGASYWIFDNTGKFTKL